MSTSEKNVQKNIIDFDHHSPELRDHNTEVLHKLIYTEPRCPMGWSEAHGGFWAIWGYDALFDAVQNTALFRSVHSEELPKGVPGAPYKDPLIPIDIDGPIQQEFRKLSLGWFNPGTAKAMEPRINEICTELIDAFIERGECDISQELFTALPARVTLEMLDWESDRWAEWIEWVHAIIHDSVLHPDKAVEGANNMYTNIAVETAKRREKLGDDLFSDMMRTKVNGEYLTDEQIRNYAMLVMLGGMDTTAGVTGNTLLEIDKDPALRQQLIDEIDFIPKAIEEFLRFAGPQGGLYRRVAEDTVFHDQPMNKDDRVLMMYWAANRDPNMFPDPEKIDIHRTNNRHMTFGLGPHRCLGSHHARLMFSTMLREIMTRLPDFKVQWDKLERFEDCGSVYAVRHMPVTFTPGKRSTTS